MILQQRSSQDILKERYKDTISSFLRDNKLYDCLAHNNQITVIDQSFSCYDVVQIFLQQQTEEVVFWNSEISNYDGVFTHTDIIKVVLHFYSTCKDDLLDPKKHIEEENGPVLPPANYRDHILMAMRHVSVSQWFKSFETDATTLVKAKMDERLHDACRKLIFSNIHRIIVVDNDSRMLVGTIQQRDILVFLIKGFSQYFTDFIAMSPNQEREQQHKLEMGYFFQQSDMEELTPATITVQGNATVYQVFHDLVHVTRRTSVPVVNERNQYLGTLHRRDFLFILRGDSFDWLERTVENYLNYLKIEKKKYNIYHLLTKDTFTMTQTVKEVVENLVLSESCFLVCLNEDNTVKEQLSIQDIFAFFLSEE